jgi:hypothetical protein
MATINASVELVGGVGVATVTSISGQPDAILLSAEGASELLAGLNLCSALVMQQGFFPSTTIEITGLPSIYALYNGI